MEQVFAAFGVDWRLLIINFINFGLLLAVLWHFLYTPLTKMLAVRREKIAQGVRDAEEAEVQLREMQQARSGVLADAGKEADSIVSMARAAGSAKERELISNGELAAANLLKDAERQAAELKSKSLEESKQEVAKLIVLGMEKLALRQAQGKQ